MNHRNSLIFAIVLAALHLAFSIWYSSVTPYRTAGILLGQRDPNTGQPQRVPDVGAPDERQHANYVQHILDGKGLPVLDPKDPNLIENYQSHQPPLFYILEAGWSKLFGGVENVQNGNGLRMLNGLIGALTVLGAYFLGLWGFRRADLGLFAAAFTAFLPMNCALSGAISNDPLLFCLSTWCLAICARGVSEGFTAKLSIAAGVLAGLAVLTKTTGLSLFAILLLAHYLGRKHEAGSFRPALMGIATWMLITVPWFLRNLSTYGDPLAMNAFKQAFVGSPQASMFTQTYGPVGYWIDWVGWWTVRSFFGVFGYMDIFLNERGTSFTGPGGPNSLYRVLLALLAVGLAIYVLNARKDEWRPTGKVQALCLGFAAIIILLFAAFNNQYFQGQARYVFPAIATFGIFLGIGILSISRQNWKIALGIMCILLAALNVYALSRIPGEFQKRVQVASLQSVGGDSFVCRSNSRHSARV